MNSFIEFRQKENLRPVNLPNKEKFYYDLENIEHSWSGRADVMSIGNTFIMEAEQQLVNALELFELGYFDCAYYSLRSAVDVSTTIVFLADMPEPDRDSFLSKWKATEDFPMQGQMIKMLSAHGDAFVDMKRQMPKFFSDAKVLSAELNKYVHKQGFQHFYVSRNHPINMHKSLDRFIADFEDYFVKCTGVVAVMRLAIDPFPVLLMDEEILYRCYDSITDPYSTDFVDEYIGEETLETYKRTARYTGMHKFFMGLEKKTGSVFDIVKNQYIDSQCREEVLSQCHLMSKSDIMSAFTVFACEKIVRVYVHNSFLWYFTDRQTMRKDLSWSSLTLTEFTKSQHKINQVYDNVFISVFNFDEDAYLVEHNELLDDSDVLSIRGALNEAKSHLDAVESDET